MACEDLVLKKLLLRWRTVDNKVDCGIFTMRRMESYFGEAAMSKWKMGLGKETPSQGKDLENLRKKYASTILLSELNTKRDNVLDRAREYQKVDPVIRRKHADESRFLVEDRVNNCG